MRIGIIGTGAMACLFASRLSALAEIVLIGSWQEQIDTLNQHGLTVEELDGSISQHQLSASADPTAVAPVDVALVLTKSYQTVEAVERASACLKPWGAAVTLQNGLGNVDPLMDELGEDRATVGVTSMGATLLRPGAIRHAGDGPIYLAQPTIMRKRLGGLIIYLRACGFDLRIVDSADSLLWGKVAINAGINPLTALLQLPNGALVDGGIRQKLMERAAVEAQTVAETLHIRLPYTDARAEVIRVAQTTASNRSSMLQDIERGAPTEIDAICGAISRAGARVGIDTPINRWLHEAIVAVEAQARPMPVDEAELLDRILSQ